MAMFGIYDHRNMKEVSSSLVSPDLTDECKRPRIACRYYLGVGKDTANTDVQRDTGLAPPVID